MNRTFAYEPHATLNVKDFRLIFGSVGLHTGLFIAKYPKKNWLKSINSYLDNIPDGFSKEQIKVLIKKANERGGFTNVGHEYDSTKDWLQNCIVVEQAFHKIIVSDNRKKFENNKIVKVSEFEPDMFGDCRHFQIHPLIENYIKLINPLVNMSNEIFIIDPYFDLLNNEQSDFFIQMLKINRSLNKVCLYTKQDVGIRGLKNFSRKISSVLKDFSNLSIVVRFVNKSEKRFHARWLLSIKGAISLDRGFYIPKLNHVNEKVDVSYVGLERHDNLCQEWIESPMIDFIEEIIKPESN